MSYTEKDIVREHGPLFMLKRAPGVYEIYRSGITHATRCGLISFKGDDVTGRAKADREFERRASLEPAA